MTASWLENDIKYPITRIKFSDEVDEGPSRNFSAIAMTDDAMFYGFNGNEILELNIQRDPSFNFEYIGKAYP